MNRNSIAVLVMLLGCTPSKPASTGPLLCAEQVHGIGGSVDGPQHRINAVEVHVYDPEWDDVKRCGHHVDFTCIELDDAPAECTLTIEP